MIKFTLDYFNSKYPTDDECLQDIFTRKFLNIKKCPECNSPFKYYKVKGRKCYACQYCSYQIHPLAKTIFHKSNTSLKFWFYTVFLFSVYENGVSSKELQRQLGVTYKCAWRMVNSVRKLFEDNNDNSLGNTA